MDVRNHMGEISETQETKGQNGDVQFSKEALEQFDKMFETGDFFKKGDTESLTGLPGQTEGKREGADPAEGQNADILEKREPHSKYESEGNTYETDDNGKTYKRNGNLLPLLEYIVNGSRYRTDPRARIVECECSLKITGDGVRDLREQKEVGGEERMENDDGGHLVAKILGGSEGVENLVPMRQTINRGDYKKMENEIIKALQEGKEVFLHISIKYEGDSRRPSVITAEYTIDGKKTVMEFDNRENSVELLSSSESKISGEDFADLTEQIKDMRSEGIDVSVTSVKTEYDEEGAPLCVIVGLRDETNNEKEYISYRVGRED